MNVPDNRWSCRSDPLNPGLAFQGDLGQGERILWAGQPDPNKLFGTADVFLVPFSPMWGGFAIFWEASVLGLTTGSRGAPLFFVLWGVPFVLVGQYFIWGALHIQEAPAAGHRVRTDEPARHDNDRMAPTGSPGRPFLSQLAGLNKSTGPGWVPSNSAIRRPLACSRGHGCTPTRGWISSAGVARVIPSSMTSQTPRTCTSSLCAAGRPHQQG